jgi:LuxR family transcriptional regulator of csgAB operon
MNDESKMNSATCTIDIIGPCRVNNELLASFLEAEMGTECTVKETIDDVLDSDREETDQPKLVLLDCFAKDPERLFLEVEACYRGLGKMDSIAVFNLIRGLRIEEELVIRGIKGIFYANDLPEHVQKGVLGLLEGKIWISREVLSKFIPETREVSKLSINEISVLSEREIEILNLVARGAMNTEIGEKLHISRHTVKSHLYNIYKKIKVTSRLEAALWAKENLHHRKESSPLQK